MKLKVVSVKLEGAVMRFLLRSADASPLPPYEAGAHIALRLNLPGVGEVSRAYSLVDWHRAGSAPASYEIGVLLEPAGRGGSRWIHEHLREGADITIDGPRNAFALDPSAGPVRLVAGGIGITPLLAMARACVARRRAFSLNYYTRGMDASAFLDEVAQLSSARSGADVRIRHGFAPRQVVEDLQSALAAPEENAHVYVCGPQGLMDAVARICSAQGWRDSQLHSERFAAPPVQTVDGGFVVHLVRSNRQLRVESGVSLLETLQAGGCPVTSSCGCGVCGSCIVPVLSGAIDHQDAFLSDGDRAEGRLMCACVSRAQGETLVLDL